MLARPSQALKIGFLSAAVIALIAFPMGLSAQVTRQIQSSGTTQIQNTSVGTPGIQLPEFDTGLSGDSDDGDLGVDLQGPGGAAGTSGKTTINRSIANTSGHGREMHGHDRAESNPELLNSYEGLNFFSQRFANNGNQFSVTPPDQALCAGNGFVLESVNDVLAVYSTQSSVPLRVTDLNTFYHYPAAINRAANPLTFGPSITDPTCHFDPDTQRWFHVVLTLDRAAPTTQNLNGKNHLDIAVSTTANPLDPWTIFSLPVQNDGTDGTPDHKCQARARINGVITLIHAQCLGDYPHIGMDKNGLFITTNEFELFSPGRFKGAQIYAVSKKGLVSGGTTNVVQFDTAGLAPALPYGLPGFTVWASLSPGREFRDDDHGNEFALSSLAVFSNTGAFNQLVLWSLSNTRSLDAPTPSVVLNAGLVDTQDYAVPPSSAQRPGDFPLGQCLADGAFQVTPTLKGCWRFFVGAGGPFSEFLHNLPSNDSRMQQVSFTDGKLYAALDTAVSVNGKNLAGAAFFVIKPKLQNGNVTGQVVNEGVVAVDSNNVTYPAVGVTEDGHGVIAFTVLGPDNFPSAGYVSLDAKSGAGPVHIAAAGAGPSDDFADYPELAGTPRPRWGDYGAAAVDGNTIWIASEYIGQTCNLNTFVLTNFTCGNTRGAFGNWSTRITKLRLDD
ncbi:MAG: hypothetical protein JWM08_1512 [Candidatus Angelobacter sp.]|nr:hypothetical protein [Candidatus Angelobacter sp.]